MNKTNVDDIVVKEILKSCNLTIFEMIVVKMFYKKILKFYHTVRINTINNL